MNDEVNKYSEEAERIERLKYVATYGKSPVDTQSEEYVTWMASVWKANSERTVFTSPKYDMRKLKKAAVEKAKKYHKEELVDNGK